MSTTRNKHPLAIARDDEWLESEEGQAAQDSSTILQTPSPDYYLRNRLMRAFEAGAKAQRMIDRGAG